MQQTWTELENTFPELEHKWCNKTRITNEPNGACRKLWINKIVMQETKPQCINTHS